MRTRNLILGATLLASATIGISTFPAAADEPDGVVADFEGTRINLRDGWGPARACTSDGTITTCYRSEADMDRAEPAAQRSGGVTPSAACSSSLRLYRSTSFGGSVLQLTIRGTYTNLSAYGFDNDTSSYKVGACSAYLYDGSSGGAPTYPGSTGANVSASSMTSGWDNRVSSVYIT